MTDASRADVIVTPVAVSNVSDTTPAAPETLMDKIMNFFCCVPVSGSKTIEDVVDENPGSLLRVLTGDMTDDITGKAEEGVPNGSG